MRARHWFGIVALTALALVGAACGDDQATGTGAPSASESEDESCPDSSESASASMFVPCSAVERSDTSSGGAAGTGDYDFTLTQPIPQAGGVQTQTAHLTINLVADGDAVTGTIDGPTDQTLTQPSCPSNTTAPGRTTAQVEGTRSEDALELRVTSASWVPPTVEPCPSGQPALIGETTPSGIDGFDESLARLERDGQGVYRYVHTETIPAGAPYTVEYDVSVRFDD
jgi:hypothetical protein